MLIPTFSIRSILIVTTLAAALAMVATLALGGHRWAVALLLTVGCLLLIFAVHAAFFVVVWIASLFTTRREAKFASSPSSFSPAATQGEEGTP